MNFVVGLLHHWASVAQWRASEGLGFNSSWGLRIFFLSHACDKMKNLSLLFFTELKHNHFSLPQLQLFGCITSPFDPYKWLTSTFSSQYHPRNPKNKGNDHQLNNHLLVKQISLVTPRTVRRICILMLGCKGRVIGALVPLNTKLSASEYKNYTAEQTFPAYHLINVA